MQVARTRAEKDRPLKIDICVCTYRRDSVADTLASLDAQILPEGTFIRVIVIDNDGEPTARERVEAAAADLSVPVTYVHAPANNISIARNAGLDAAEADWVAFIDDDETAAPDWLANLLKQATANDLDAVFGPAWAVYPENAPAWMRQEDYHSNIPVRRGKEVEGGYTCNVMMRTNSPHVKGRRFSLDKGKTGGEDTEFFYQMLFSGAKFGIADDAAVYEAVDPKRLSAEWIRNRKYRYGLSYGYNAVPKRTALALAKFAITSSVKAAFSLAMCVAMFWSERRRNFWFIRSVFHFGALRSVFSGKVPEQY